MRKRKRESTEIARPQRCPRRQGGRIYSLHALLQGPPALCHHLPSDDPVVTRSDCHGGVELKVSEVMRSGMRHIRT